MKRERLPAAELLGRQPNYLPSHYLGAYKDADPEALRLERFCLELGAELPGDYNPIHCTTVAWVLRDQLGDIEIFGFDADENPSAESALVAGGHDFAVYRGRFIVDPWSVDSLNQEDGAARKYVHDLSDRRDHEEIRRLYGERTLWEDISEFDSPQEREYGEYEDEMIVQLAREGRPGAIDEADWRGLDYLAPAPTRKRKAALR